MPAPETTIVHFHFIGHFHCHWSLVTSSLGNSISDDFGHDSRRCWGTGASLSLMVLAASRTVLSNDQCPMTW
jgi:hypothetical protein